MPPIGEQIELGWTFSADFHGGARAPEAGPRYSEAVKQFQPYDRVQEPQPDLRRDLLQLIKTSVAAPDRSIHPRQQPRRGERPGHDQGCRAHVARR